MKNQDRIQQHVSDSVLIAVGSGLPLTRAFDGITPLSSKPIKAIKMPISNTYMILM